MIVGFDVDVKTDNRALFILLTHAHTCRHRHVTYTRTHVLTLAHSPKHIRTHQPMQILKNSCKYRLGRVAPSCEYIVFLSLLFYFPQGRRRTEIDILSTSRTLARHLAWFYCCRYSRCWIVRSFLTLVRFLICCRRNFEPTRAARLMISGTVLH